MECCLLTFVCVYPVHIMTFCVHFFLFLTWKFNFAFLYNCWSLQFIPFWEKIWRENFNTLNKWNIYSHHKENATPACLIVFNCLIYNFIKYSFPTKCYCTGNTELPIVTYKFSSPQSFCYILQQRFQHIATQFIL